MLSRIAAVVSLLFGIAAFSAPSAGFATPSFGHGLLPSNIEVTDFGVPHNSTVPANTGEQVLIAVRELVKSDTRRVVFRHRGPWGRSRGTVLFVHGASVPGVAAFDFDFKGYSWAGYLANAGFDVFIMDFTGYGFSPRPEMTNACNTAESAQQAQLVPNPLPAGCEPDYPYVLTNVQAERDEIDSVVNYIRSERNVEKVNIVGWSLGGLRAGTYTSLNPDKVEKLVLYASCCYNPDGSSTPPTPIPGSGVPIQTQTFSGLINDRWLSNACSSEVEDGATQAAWNQVMRYDPLGSTWGTPPWNPVSSPEGGIMRYPSWQIWGWNQEAAKRINIPTLVIVGEKDGLYSTNQSIYADLGARNKVFVGMECATHFAVWERQHTVLQEASRDWLLNASVRGVRQGILSADTRGRFHRQ